MNDTSLHAWLICEKTGKTLATHCNCMAGLGEACSHVAAVMFYVECAVRIRNSKTVTDEKAYWMLPPALENVPYCPISDMDFKSPSTKKKELDQKIESIGKEESQVKDLPYLTAFTPKVLKLS